jgi:predicted RNase H-like HicB family nuclease
VCLWGRNITSRFTAVFEHRDDWWIGYVEELPGADTQGRSLEEARQNLKEAVQLVIPANRRIAREEVRDHVVIREELAVAV